MLDRTTSTSTPKKKKRWALRLFLALIVLLIAIVITVQIVLGTAYPKNLVLAQVERALGLNVQAKSFSTGWFGHTVLRDVTISLPLADQAFLTVPELRVEHSTLPMIALRRSVKLDSIEFEHPALVVRQDQTGRWDLQQAFELITRTSGAKNTEEQKQPTLPALALVDGTIHVVDNKGREATIEPVTFHGEPQNSLAWQFDAKVGDQLSIEGAVNPGRVWEHSVKFAVAKIDPWLKPWVTNLPEPLAIAGKWEGRVTGGQLVGQARLDRAVVSDIKATGVVNIARDDTGVHLRPDGFVIESPTKLAPEIRATSGEVTIEANQVIANALRCSAAGGDVQINGNYSWANVAGQIEASWEQLTLPAGVVHGGSARASIKTPLPNRPEITAELHSRGKTGTGKWVADLNLTGKGESWQKIEWTLAAPLLEFSAIKHHMIVHSVGARLATANDKLQLLEITHEGPEILRGTGELNLSDKNWTLDVSAGALPMPNSTTGTLDLAVQAAGNSIGSIDLKKAHLRQADLTVEAKGFYDTHLPKPVNITLNVSQTPTIAEEVTDPLMKGHLECAATVAGTLQPMDIGVAGNLQAQQLSVRNHVLGDATLQYNGQLNSDGANVTTTELTAFGGRWNVNATWAGEDEPVKVHAAVRDLPVEELAPVLKQHDISGKLAGQWDLVTSSLRPSQMKLTGRFRITDPAAGPIGAERITSVMSMENGIVHLEQLEAQKEDGRLKASARFPLLHPTQWHFEGQMSQWPQPLARADSSLRLKAQTSFDADFSSRTATGTLTASSDIVLNNKPAGDAKLSATASGDVINFSSISAKLIGGTLSGSAVYHMNDPLQSNVLIQLKDVDAQRVAGIWPKLSEVSGVYNALVVAAPATDPRALGPLRLSLTVFPTNGKFRTISIGNIDVVAFADRQEGQSRIVIDDSMLNLADGQVRVWGRRSQHPPPTTGEARLVSTQMDVQLSQLDLDQLEHAFKPDEKPVPGRVDGSFVIAGNPRDWERLYGTGHIRLTKSDLGNNKLFAGIYNFLNLHFGQRAPDGHGSADLRLQGDLLEIDNARYRIGGAEIRLNCTVSRLWNAPNSPIRGRGIASAQPFADWKIPFIKEAGDFFATLQTSTVSAFRISGSVGDPKTTLAAFAEAADIFRDLLGMRTHEDE